MNSNNKKQQKLFESWRRYLKEEEVPQQAAQPTGSWPSSPPKKVEIKKGSSFTPQQIQQLWNKMASLNPPKNPDEVLASIGGIQTLTKNINGVASHFANSDNNPNRSAMPVVEPDGGDFEDLKARLPAGKLDFKEPFSPDEEKFPTGLDTQSPEVQQKFLTKGDRDGKSDDDKSVSLSKAPISVGSSYPTQKQVYLDKCIWNILNFGPTPVGGTAHGKPNLIAIQAGEKVNYILDGHHRWSSAWISGGKEASINVQILKGLDIATGIAALRSYGNARGNKQKT